jgi:hypothetical protein
VPDWAAAAVVVALGSGLEVAVVELGLADAEMAVADVGSAADAAGSGWAAERHTLLTQHCLHNLRRR